MGLFDAKVDAVLAEFLAHVAGVAAGAAVQRRFGQARQEGGHADALPVQPGSFHLAEFALGLGENVARDADTVQSFCRRDVFRPAHIRHKRRRGWRGRVRPRQFKSGHGLPLIIAWSGLGRVTDGAPGPSCIIDPEVTSTNPMRRVE